MSNPSTIDSPDWSVHPDNSSKFNDLWRQLQKLNIQQSAPPQHSFSAEEFVEINPTSQGIWSSQQPINSLPNIEDEITTQNLYKTELCRSFEETGTCRYSSKCQFAHGRSELRPVLRHPKYKTEVCKTFHTIGTCPYGKRCRFIHISPDIFLEDDPLPLNEPTAISTPPTTTTITTTTKIPIHNPYVPPLTPQRTSQPINYMSMTPISQEKEKKNTTSVPAKPKSILNTHASEWSTTWKPTSVPNINPIGQERQQFSMPLSNVSDDSASHIAPSRDNERSRLAIFQQFTNPN